MKLAPIDISPFNWEIVRTILQLRIPEREVWAFGSRANWTAREYSDLDLAVIGDEPLALAVRAALVEDFEESDLPFKVDVVEWATTKERFRKIIEKDCVVVQEGARGRAGRMGDEWSGTTIGTLLSTDGGSVKTGPFGTALKAKEYPKDGVPLISVGEVGYGSLRVHEKTPRVPPHVVERLPGCVLEAGDIVFGRKGAVDRSALVKPEQAGWFLGSDGIRLRLPSSCNARFIAYQLQSPYARSWLLQHATGTTMASLNHAIIEQIPIVLPPLSEQRAIAHILGTLDDKIELNRRMNETLEAQAAALFKSWFVNFDPVRARAEGRDTGLPEPIADLFPDHLVDSELGKIPEGWEVGTVGDLAGLSRAGWKPGEFRDEVFDHYSIPAYDEGRTPKAERGEAIKSNKLLVLRECVLLSKLNPRIPRVWLPSPQASRRSICSTEFLVAVPKPGLSRDFLYCLFSNDRFIAEFSTLVTGTSGSHQRVRPQALLALALVLPPTPLVQYFTQAVSRFLRRVAENRVESRTLAALRDTLLPRLISGELRVPDVERVVTRAES